MLEIYKETQINTKKKIRDLSHREIASPDISDSHLPPPRSASEISRHLPTCNTTTQHSSYNMRPIMSAQALLARRERLSWLDVLPTPSSHLISPVISQHTCELQRSSKPMRKPSCLAQQAALAVSSLSLFTRAACAPCVASASASHEAKFRPTKWLLKVRQHQQH